MKVPFSLLIVPALIFANILSGQNIGIGHNIAEGLLDINGDLVLRSADLTLEDGTTLAVNVEINPYSNFRISGPTADFNIAGISYSPDGKLLSFYNRSGHTMTIIHESADAEPSERIHTGTGFNIAVPDKASISFIYDGGAQRWVVRSHSAPGPWILSENRMYNTHTGNVGIGTQHPAYKLTVNGNGYFLGSHPNFAMETVQGSHYLNTPGLQIVSPNTDNYPAGIQQNVLAINGNQIQSFVRDIDDPSKSDYARPMVLNPLGGSVGIGTNYIPGYAKLEIAVSPESRAISTGDGIVGMVHFLGGADRSMNSLGGYFGTSTNHPLHFYTNSQWAQVTLLPNGNLGVGTTIPEQKLHVQGAIKLGGAVYEPIRTIYGAGTYNINEDDHNIHVSVPNNFTGTIYFQLPPALPNKGRVLNFSSDNLPIKPVEGAANEGIASTIRFLDCTECPVLQKVSRSVSGFKIYREATCFTLQSDGFGWVVTKTNAFFYNTYD